MFLIIITDQISKYFILKFIPIKENFSVINILTLTPILKKDILQNSNIFVSIVLPLAVIIFFLNSISKSIKYLRSEKIYMSLFCGGVMGNIIDKIFRSGEIVKFIDIKWISFIPVFNIADFAVAICGVIMILSLLIKDRSNL